MGPETVLNWIITEIAFLGRTKLDGGGRSWPTGRGLKIPGLKQATFICMNIAELAKQLVWLKYDK